MKKYYIKLIISWILIFALFITCANYILKYQSVNKELAATQNELEMTREAVLDRIEANASLEENLIEANATIDDLNKTINDLKSTEYEFVYLGDYKLTAYCACEICCEEWALNRPKDANGNPIVYTATGTVAKQGRTIGVNPSVIPYGTEVYISGLGWRVAEDTGAINGNHIDVYMDSHEAALSSGPSGGDVWMLVKKS